MASSMKNVEDRSTEDRYMDVSELEWQLIGHRTRDNGA